MQADYSDLLETWIWASHLLNPLIIKQKGVSTIKLFKYTVTVNVAFINNKNKLF